MNNGKLPEFIISGFQKCGTTALKYNLNKHSHLSLPGVDGVSNNELNFFRVGSSNNTFSRGLDWYMSLFTGGSVMQGESSPNYSFEPEQTASKMYEIHPNVKLIFILRNPLDRALSAFNHYLQVMPRSVSWGNWNPNASFSQNLKIKGAFGDLNYAHVLKTYIRLFDRSQLHIVIQEQLHTNPQPEFDKIFKFLGVETQAIKNTIVHSRPHKHQLSILDRVELSKLFVCQVNELYDFLGYTIADWTDWN
jgi:hypothetical protein